MGALTTHVLDTAQGRPGAGIRVELFDVNDDRRPVTSVRTNQDGRCDAPLLEGDAFRMPVSGSWCSTSASTSPRPTCRPPIRRSWTASRSASGSPTTPTTTCRCWWHRGATPPTEAVEPAAAVADSSPVVGEPTYTKPGSAEPSTCALVVKIHPAREARLFLSTRNVPSLGTTSNRKASDGKLALKALISVNKRGSCYHNG